MPNTEELKRLDGQGRAKLFHELHELGLLPTAGRYVRDISRADTEDQRQMLDTLSPFLLDFVLGDIFDDD